MELIGALIQQNPGIAVATFAACLILLVGALGRLRL